VGHATITLRVTDGSGKPVSGARLKLEGNMSHAGMAPVFADAPEVEPGRYRTSMELTMAGDWIVLVHLTLANGTKVDQQFEIKGVAPA
jgi:YtkA-like